MPRKSPPPGFERHPRDPNLIRKIVPQTTAQSLWPTLPSSARSARGEPKRNVNGNVGSGVSLAKAIWPHLRSGR